MTSSEAVELGNTIKPLLLKGHSPYQIIAAHPELGISEKTLYNYIEQGVFECVGIANIDLRIKVKRKMTAKKKTIYKKRQDRKFLVGRLYTDYQSYVESEEITHILQMDTVYNDISNGPFIQTFKFIKYGLLFAVYHDTKTAADMVDGLAVLDSILGKSLFEQEAHITLTDRGGEFTDAEHMEKRDDGTRRTRVFYCDPMQSGQKGSLENMHRELRYILPNEVDLRSIGLTDQTVYNDISNGPFIQTFKFIKYGLLFAVYHDTKTAADMVDGLAVLDSILGKSLFEQEAHITLTDRGGEFTDAEHMEKRDDGTRRTRVFYCDPMQSGQKGSLENMHRELRYILPNEVDLRSIGLTDQTSLNVAISHINSSAKEHLNGKSPFELCEFMCPELAQKLYEFGLQKIEKDEVILRPSILTHK
ncbi:hypothetical protein [[Clostridium] innocuum]|uniref:hypothetical protein n=1 Tax=Clostridium innocuum TaxID=1522 RepID=UPI003A598AAE